MKPPESQKRYKDRQHFEETPFAVLKVCFDMLRGREGVSTEFQWACSAFNLKKMMTLLAGMRTTDGDLTKNAICCQADRSSIASKSVRDLRELSCLYPDPQGQSHSTIPATRVGKNLNRDNAGGLLVDIPTRAEICTGENPMFVQWLRRLSQEHDRRRNPRRTYPLSAEVLELRELLAANLFVATTGNDIAGQGTAVAPYATLTRALAVARDGDTVILRGGTYAGGVEVDDPNITIRSFDNEWAVISAPTTNIEIAQVIRFTENASGGKLQRLEIVGGYYYGVKIDGLWDVDPADRMSATGVIIEDSRIHDTGRDAIKITPGCDDVIVRRNEIFRSGRRDPGNAEGIDNVNGDRMLVQDNYIHDIATNGVYAKGGSIGTVMERNLIRNIGGAGILLGFRDTDEEWFDITVNPGYYENVNGVVRNNIIVNTTYAGIGLYAARNPTISGNTLIDVAQTGQAGLQIDSSETYIGNNPPLLVASRNVKFANNIVKLSSTTTRPAFEIRAGGLSGTLQTTSNRYFHSGTSASFLDRRTGHDFIGGLAAWKSHIASETGSSEGDPQLNASLHLKTGSPCIDAGSSLFNVSHDYDGNTRSSLMDIGADEFGAGTTLPVPPTAGTIGTGARSSDAPQVRFSANSSLTTEAITSARVVVSLSAPSTETVTVRYTVSSGSATSGVDFLSRVGTATFLPGQTVVFISFAVKNDALDENNETVNVALSNPMNAVLGGLQRHTYMIQDNDPMPTVQYSSSDTRLNESTTNGSVAITLSAMSGRPVSVSYHVVSATATGGVDYSLSNGTVVFQPGQTQRLISFRILEDLRDEYNENVVLSLSTSGTADLGALTSHVITILDNDLPPSFRFNIASSSVNESAGTAVAHVALSAASGKTVRVNYIVVSGTATGGGVDFSNNSGTLIYAPGETTKSVRIAITNDTRRESNESFQIRLSSPVNSTSGTITSHTVTIIDNDTPIPALITFRLPDGHVYRVNPQAAATPVDMTLALNSLSPGTRDDNLNVSPDGRWLALTTDRFGIGSSWTGLAVVAADLTSGVAVRINGEVVHPEGAVAVASGGNRVVYSSADGPHVRDLWAATRSNGVWTTRLLTANSPYAYNSQPAISADGTKVLFDGGTEPFDTGSDSICEVRTNGTAFRQVVTHAMRPAGTSDTGGIHHADYTLDGGIVFEAPWTGDQIWRLASGSSQPVLMSKANNEVAPCVLPDGRIVTLWLNRPGNSNGFHELTVRSSSGVYLFTLLPGVDVVDIGLSCGG